MSDRAVKASIYTFLVLVSVGWVWHTFWSPYGGLRSGLFALGAGLLGGYVIPTVLRYRRDHEV